MNDDFRDFENYRTSHDAEDGALPPYDADAEGSILSACMFEGARYCDPMLAALKPTDFFNEGHQLIFAAIGALHAQSRPTDTVSVQSYMNDVGTLKKIPAGYLTRIISENACEALSFLLAYAKTVKDKSRRREWIIFLSHHLGDAYKPCVDTQAMLDEAAEVVHAFTRADAPVVSEKFSLVAHKVTGSIQEARRLHREGAPPQWVQSGIRELDEMVTAIRPGTLTIIAARPGVGKSAFALNNLAIPVVRNTGDHVAYINLEMSNEEVVERAIASGAEISAENLRDKVKMTDDEYRKYLLFVNDAKEYPIHFFDKVNLSINELRAHIKRLKIDAERQKKKLALVVLDYLQLMPGRKGVNRQEQVAEISRSLKHLSKEANVPVVALSQLNRNSDSRSGADTIPRISEMRESGAIEQDADLILMIHREFKKGESHKALMIVGKQRGGRTGTIDLRFNGSRVRFESP